MPVVVKAHFVKDKKLGLGTEIDRVSNTSESEVAFCPSANATCIEPIAFLCYRIDDVGDETQGLLTHERVDPVTRRIGHQQHVRLMNRSPTTQGRAVESEAIFERALAKLIDRKSQMVPRSNEVREAYVDVRHLFIFCKLQHIPNAHVNCSFYLFSLTELVH